MLEAKKHFRPFGPYFFFGKMGGGGWVEWCRPPQGPSCGPSLINFTMGFSATYLRHLAKRLTG